MRLLATWQDIDLAVMPLSRIVTWTGLRPGLLMRGQFHGSILADLLH